MGRQFRELQEILRRVRNGKLKRRLIFELEVGTSVAARVQANYAQLGSRPPKRVSDVPSIEPSYEVWWNAWQDLSTERRFSGGQIPYGAIRAYGSAHRLEIDALKRIVWALDSEYMSKKQDMAKSSADAAQSRTGRRGRQEARS